MSSTRQYRPQRQPYQRQPQRQRRDNEETEAAGAPVEKRKPVFVKVEDLKPGTHGHTLVAKVISATSVSQKGSANPRNALISECLIADDTASILFTARNDQVELMKEGNTVIIRNGKIDMFKGSMRLAVDKWGRIEVTEPATFAVKEDNNLSLVEYELVTVSAEG